MTIHSPPDLVLASTSPYRRVLLERLGLPFRVASPDLDEEAFPRAGLSPRELADMRGRELAMIFQNPRGALNPIRTVGDQIAEAILRINIVIRKKEEQPPATSPPGL